jgi:hypothetical protein
VLRKRTCFPSDTPKTSLQRSKRRMRLPSPAHAPTR